jgi:hypothetical protein
VHSPTLITRYASLFLLLTSGRVCLSLCLQGLEKVSIGSYKIGAGLLTGLFFYDIFWFFGVSVQ